ncbi:hypothetical protein E2R56_31520 [Rhodococcus qingshengii]|nr:hypothetical protein E2R56_31520 [Rhodococcus qingshengii]
MSVDFCDARQGGGAYGKTPATRPFYGSWPFAGLLLTWLDRSSILAISHIIHWLYSINQYWLLAIAYVVSIS